MVSKLRDDADRIRKLLRPPWGRLRELEVKPSTKPAPHHRDPRVARDGLHDMRMPPYMRDSDAAPLSLTHRQYADVMALIDTLVTAKDNMRSMLLKADDESSAARRANVHLAVQDTPIRRRVQWFTQHRSIADQVAERVAKTVASWGTAPDEYRIAPVPVVPNQAAPAEAPPDMAKKIFPLNLTARAAYHVPGNPESTRLESGVGNCYPGLEFDHRNLDRRFLPGLEFEFVSSEPRLQGCRLLGVDLSDPGLSPTSGASPEEVAAPKR